jgi:hypothetical protein
VKPSRIVPVDLIFSSVLSAWAAEASKPKALATPYIRTPRQNDARRISLSLTECRRRFRCGDWLMSIDDKSDDQIVDNYVGYVKGEEIAGRKGLRREW